MVASAFPGEIRSPAALPIDLRFAIAALNERFNACNLISLKDIDDELPSREISRAEIDRLLMNLADHGICIVDGDAADLLAR